MAYKELPGKLHFAAPPLAKRRIPVDRNRAGEAVVGLIQRVVAMVVIAIVEEPAQYAQIVFELVAVFQVQVAVLVGGARPRVVEDRLEGCRGNLFFPGGIDPLQRKVVQRQSAEYAVGLFVVRILSEAVIVCRVGEFREKGASADEPVDLMSFRGVGHLPAVNGPDATGSMVGQRPR